MIIPGSFFKLSFNSMFVSFLSSFLHDQSDRNSEMAFEVANIKPCVWSNLCPSRTRKSIIFLHLNSTQKCRNSTGMEVISVLCRIYQWTRHSCMIFPCDPRAGRLEWPLLALLFKSNSITHGTHSSLLAGTSFLKKTDSPSVGQSAEGNQRSDETQKVALIQLACRKMVTRGK